MKELLKLITEIIKESILPLGVFILIVFSIVIVMHIAFSVFGILGGIILLALFVFFVRIIAEMQS